MMSCLLSKISFIKKIYRSFFRLYLEKRRKLNPVKTLWFNVRFLPWRQARYLPFFIHGPLTAARKGGLLLLDIPDSEQKPEHIHLGYNVARFSTNYAGTLLPLSGTIRWKGAFRCNVNTGIGTCKPGVSLKSVRYISIGTQAFIRAYRSIVLEHHVAIAHDRCVYDTDFHPFLNILTGKILSFSDIPPRGVTKPPATSQGGQHAQPHSLPVQPLSIFRSYSYLSHHYEPDLLL